MKKKRNHFLCVLTALVLLAAVTTTVFASARSAQENCGLFTVLNGDNNAVFHLAVCVTGEDGDYVYCGTKAIGSQYGSYVSLINGDTVNEAYNLENYETSDRMPGIYRYELGEAVGNASRPDIFPKAASVKSGETVYFTKLIRENLSLGGQVFSAEQATVKSVKNGTISTKENMESKTQSSDIQAVFNDSGDLVGIWKNGTVYSVVQKNSGSGLVTDMIRGAVVGVIGFGIGSLIRYLKKKKKKASVQQEPPRDYGETKPVSSLDSEETTLNYDPDWNSGDSGLVLVCRGGYQDGRVYPITRNGVTIGRMMDNTIRYPENTPGVSRHHVKLYYDGGRLMLMDCGSSNGTFLQRTGRLSPMVPTAVRQGDIFYLGERINGFEIAYK